MMNKTVVEANTCSPRTHKQEDQEFKVSLAKLLSSWSDWAT